MIFRFLYVLIVLSVSCNTATEREILGLVTKQAMVVSAREEASKIGSEIMKQGGNAFDAMVATELALAVAYPTAGNIGGGGFMVYRTKDGEYGSLDYREKAPQKAHRDMYLDSLGNVIPNLSTLGALSVGVPGTIAGIVSVHERFGSMNFKDLIQPAIDLAKKGFIATEKQYKKLNRYQATFLEANQRSIYFTKEWKEGDTIRPSFLANTLERIRDHGRLGFYLGKTADLIVQYIQERGGILTHEDLSDYKAVWRKPIVFDYKGYTIISMYPPSSGGICLAQILKSLEPFDLSSLGHNSPKYIQLVAEAERRAFADRSFYLGDPDFVDIPIEILINKKYNEKRMSDFKSKQATKSENVGHGTIKIIESDETTHYSIIDPFGNAVAVTTTLNGNYGSKLFVKEGGFFLNNEMDDFSSKPGEPNVYGLVGAEANAIEPEKRMLSSMTPTIVLKDGKVKMVVGTPGGSTIITSVLQSILNVLEFNMTMQKAVSMPRFHHQWLPDNIKMEVDGFSPNTIRTLENWGYEIDESDNIIIGKVDAILVNDDGTLEGGADPRGDDAAVGF